MTEHGVGVVRFDALCHPALALAEVVRVMDAAIAAADGTWQVQATVNGLVRAAVEAGIADDSTGLQLLRAAHDAIAYRLAFDGGRCTLEPFMEQGEVTLPPRTSAQPDDVIDSWEAIQAVVTHPVWRSRLGHLLIATDRLGGRKRVEVASAAVSDYLAASQTIGFRLDTVDTLRAALSLTKQFRLRQQRNLVLTAMVQQARRTLEEDPHKAGVVLRLAKALAAESNAPEEVDTILAAARAVYADDVNRTDEVIGLQLKRTRDTVRRAGLWRERVRAWLSAATDAEGLIRAHYLEAAVQRADRSGDPALRDEATARLQHLRPEDLTMMRIQVGMTMRGADLAEAVRSVTHAPNWMAALEAFAMLGPPSGHVDDNRRAAEEHAQEFVLSALLPVVQYGTHALPRFAVKSDADRAAYQLTQQETFQLQVAGGITCEALQRFPDHHGLPGDAELAAFFRRNTLVDSTLAGALSRSFLRWWAGDYEGAAFTVTPRIEALARTLLLHVDPDSYVRQRRAALEQYPALRFLLEHLQRAGFPETWYRFLFTFLANPLGWNVRNELCHGTLERVDRVTSAMLLQCAAHLALISVTTRPAPVDEEPSAAAG